MEALTSGGRHAPPGDGFAPIVRRLALAFAVTVALMLPGGYFSLKYSNLAEHAETVAVGKAAAVNALATVAPEWWQFQTHRLEDLLRDTDAQAGTRAVVRGVAGNLIVAVGDLPPAPTMVRSRAVYDSGRVIAYVDIVSSCRGILIGTLFAGLLGLLFAGMAYGVLFVLPLRALQRMSAALVHEQEELRESQERYQQLFNINPLPLWVHDEATLAFLAVNDAMVTTYGWSREEFLAMTIEDIRRPEDISALRATLADGRDARVHIASTHRRRDGALLDVEIRSHRFQFAGHAARIVSAYDVTQSKRAAAELRKSIAFRELLLEAIPLPVFYKDAACLYTGCNSAFTRFIGKRRDEVIGKSVFEVSPASFAKDYYDRDFDLLHGPVDAQVYESRVTHADGTAHDVIFHKARMSDDGGTPTGIVGAIADITDIRRMAAARDRLEAQLRESQKFEALGTLAGGIAHDFNNIIAMIAGNAELAREDLDSAHPARVSLDEILKASRRARDLVGQILAFGRRQAIERKVISLEPAVVESARLLRSTLPAGVCLNVECAPDAPAVLADPNLIQQLLINLGTNAWQAMRGSGTGAIEIRLHAHEHVPGGAGDARAPISRGDLQPGRYACLTVRDNGPGMDEATCARIFEPFFTTKPVGEGTGLGLSVVLGIVQQHAASIEVRSGIGEGTTFHIYFPEVDGVAADAETVHGPDAKQGRQAFGDDDKPVSAGEGKRILFVDDDDAMILLLTRLLERRGYRVRGYVDARAALAAVRAAPDQFDLAVTDFNMPGMSGLDVARALRNIRPELPVAVITGYITEELRAEAPAAGVCELIYKPDSVEELCDAIARMAQILGAPRPQAPRQPD